MRAWRSSLLLLFTGVLRRGILRSSHTRSSPKFISKIVHRTDLIRGCWNQGKALGAAVHYLQALASEGSQKGTFHIGSAKALTHRVTICLGENDSHAKESRAVLISSAHSGDLLGNG